MLSNHVTWRKIVAACVHPDRAYRYALHFEHTLGHRDSPSGTASGWNSRARRCNRDRVALQRCPTHCDRAWDTDDGGYRHCHADDLRERRGTYAAPGGDRRGSRCSTRCHSLTHGLLCDGNGIRRRESQRRRATERGRRYRLCVATGSLEALSSVFTGSTSFPFDPSSEVVPKS
jgi:hypothetical protein